MIDISAYLYYPLWYLFKLQNRNLALKTQNKTGKIDNHALENKEKYLHDLILANRGKSFLEIGIGPHPIIERIQVINSQNIKYLGCDFEYVCEIHKKELKSAALLKSNIKFASNKEGTYAWTLFQLLREDKQFDLIYIDGNHTFYIDLPAFILSHYLLNPGGYLIVDDLDWTLKFLKRNMMKYFNDWYFYRHMYRFSEYSEEQQNIPHIRLIVEELIVKKLRYLPIKKYQVYDWQVFRKP